MKPTIKNIELYKYSELLIPREKDLLKKICFSVRTRDGVFLEKLIKSLEVYESISYAAIKKLTSLNFDGITNNELDRIDVHILREKFIIEIFTQKIRLIKRMINKIERYENEK